MEHAYRFGPATIDLLLNYHGDKHLINRVAVQKKYRRQGHARRALQELLKIADTDLILVVEGDLPNSEEWLIRFYQSVGFELLDAKEALSYNLLSTGSMIFRR
jgi:GNAT superfamily N-acetyltransferase